MSYSQRHPMWRYVEETNPARPFLGIKPQGKALVIMWERRTGSAALVQAGGGPAWNGRVTPGTQLSSQ
jgi:hypothetical protein